VAAVTGGAIGWFANVNVFGGTAMEPVTGRAITAVPIGGGHIIVSLG
jgi:hypothetical protein